MTDSQHAGIEAQFADHQRAPVTIDALAFTDIGRVRTENQDAVLMPQCVMQSPRASVPWRGQVSGDHRLILAVIDGMGGHAGGADAASIVASGLRKVGAADPSERTPALEALSDKVLAAGQAWETPDMGATMAMLIVDADGVRVLNLGDCRVLRLVDGYLAQMSVVDRAETPHGPVVTQCIGGPPRVLDPHELAVPHLPGRTRYLLCSDGLILDTPGITEILTEGTPYEAATTLVTHTLEVGAPDNVSVIVVDIHAGR